ncbi:MAG TPA: ATP-dependent DNA helicase [Candidatus Saccharimonadales bacterium]|nr:ATP-dependent DNA helicase [Candidatus Saccharimonadales bacterium]
MTSTDTFDKAYAALNDDQRNAVDTIDGPVLVVAGPGTGKTQLLSMRAANILRQTDLNPENILCLTFTEEAARNMSERLNQIIGRPAYDVPIMTFHGFGSSVIGQNGEYFFKEIGAEPFDEIKEYTILEEIFKKLPSDNPLAVQWEESYYFLRGATRAISDFKSDGLLPEDVEVIARDNLNFIAFANGVVADHAAGFVKINSKTTPSSFNAILESFKQYQGPTSKKSYDAFEKVSPLSEHIALELEVALNSYAESGRTQPLTKFKEAFLDRDGPDSWKLKDTDANLKLLAMAQIYRDYIRAIRAQNLFDYSDMILKVAKAMEDNDELRLSLQETYQYILVDEFQDTSGSQLRLLKALTDNPVNEDRPNIMAVGDDNQAIYSFQGANTSDTRLFFNEFRETTVIKLAKNYRSHQQIIDDAAFVLGESDPTIQAVKERKTGDGVAHHRFASETQQFQWLVNEIKKRIDDGVKPGQIAIIAREHKSLQALAPFLSQADIPTAYERRENILQTVFMQELIQLTKLVLAIARNDQNSADALLPEVLSYKFWGLTTEAIWQLYLVNYRKQRPWLEIVRANDDRRASVIADFLLTLAMRTKDTSLETMLDYIIGVHELQLDSEVNGQTTLSFVEQSYTSPYKEYWFGEEQLHEHTFDYLELLSHLNFLRTKLRSFNGRGDFQTLNDFMAYLTLCEHAGIRLVDTTPHRERNDAVQLNSAHGVKGLEFDHVFIIDANQDKWARRTSHYGQIMLPSNLRIERATATEGEDRRILYVAMTRPARELVVTGYTSSSKGDEPVKFLTADENGNIPEELVPRVHAVDESSHADLTDQMLNTWYERHIQTPMKPELHDLLLPTLESYRLSATHLGAFLDIERAGPKQFLLNYLLHFPQRTRPPLAFGNAIHTTLKIAHDSVKDDGSHRPIEVLITDFERELHRYRLDPDDEARLKERGARVLNQYFEKRYDSFKPDERFEYDFAHRRLVIEGGVRVTGKIDRITPLGNNTYRLTDFKTGRPKDISKNSIQLHGYKRQLNLYRLLVEESRVFGANSRVTETAIDFVEPDSQGRLADPSTFVPTDEDIARLKLLMKAVWDHIMRLDFPDTSQFEQNLKGQIAFENMLIEESS